MHDCGATTPYSNIVYIAPINQKFHNKDKVFSAYKCYKEELEIKIINEQSIEIKTTCGKLQTFVPSYKGITVNQSFSFINKN